MMSLQNIHESCEESGIPTIKCKQCGKTLKVGETPIDPEDTYKFRDKRVINGQVVIAHWYSCRSCALELVTPLCEDIDHDCEIGQPGNPEKRISKLKYDGGHGETVCKSCGLVQEEVSLSAMAGYSNPPFPKPKEPKNYSTTLQELADDPQINWFNYRSDEDFTITCKTCDEPVIQNRYPNAEVVLI
jgi:hypothetical protein